MTQVLSSGKSLSWDNVASPTLDLSPCCIRADGDSAACHLTPEDSSMGNCPVARTAGLITLTDGSAVCLRLAVETQEGTFQTQGLPEGLVSCCHQLIRDRKSTGFEWPS